MVNTHTRRLLDQDCDVLAPACDAAERDEQWTYAGNKLNQRRLWHDVDHKTNTVLAYVFGKSKDEEFRKLKELLEPFGILNRELFE